MKHFHDNTAMLCDKQQFRGYQRASDAGKGDQFMYRYDYDADNRLRDAYSSREGMLWRHDARYDYYLHGPLARMELGSDKVQGVDYAYTLQGWLKGINGQSLDAAKDMAGDGDPAGTAYRKFGRDVYAYSLGYYTGDYKPIGGPSANAFDKTFAPPTGVAGTTGRTGRQLYNGNISHTTVAMNKINGGQTTGYTYLYDQLNRLLGMRQHDISSTAWNYSSYNTAYEEQLSYDGNGNIKTLVRKGANVTGMPPGMDNLKYYYYYTKTDGTRGEYDPTAALPNNVKTLTNQLAHVTDTDPAGNYTNDIDNQAAGNYNYDNAGNLIKDNAEGITGVGWNVYGKITRIEKTDGTSIYYTYDASGNRVVKDILDANGEHRQFYIRDAQGNVLAVYDDKGNHIIEWSEQHLGVYPPGRGSSRLGMWQYGKAVPLAPTGVSYDSVMIGSTAYELTNHLGNVLATISDKKIGHSTDNTTVDYYNAEVLQQTDYYSFGMTMPGRKYGGAGRYGFNGKEDDKEVAGQQDYGMRFYDKRLGRFKSVDPLTDKYPELTPYQFASNRPIDGVDLDGAEWKQKITQYKDGWVVTDFTIVIKVKNSSKILSDAQVWSRALSMKKDIGKAYSKRFDDRKYVYNAKVAFQMDNYSSSKTDFFFDFVDWKSSGKTYKAGQATGGIGSSNINRIEITGTLNGKPLYPLTRTAIHELGHTGGLEHPHQPHGDKLDPITEKNYKAGNINDNVMIWGSKGGYGTGITYEQFRIINQVIQKNINQLYFKRIDNPASVDTDATGVRKDIYFPSMPYKDNSQVIKLDKDYEKPQKN